MIIWWMSNFIPSLSNNNDDNCCADITVESWRYLFYTFTLHSPICIRPRYCYFTCTSTWHRKGNALLLSAFIFVCVLFLSYGENTIHLIHLLDILYMNLGALTDFVSQKEIHAETFFFRMKYVKTIIIKLHK